MEASDADLVLESRNFVLAVNDGLLDSAFIALEFDQLPLEVVVFLALEVNLRSEVLEVSHYERIEHFYVLVVLSGQMVFHQTNFLPQKVDLLLVIPQQHHAVLNELLICQTS